MLKFTTVAGEILRLRPGLILGAITGVAQTGPILGTATLITQVGQLGPVKMTPDDVWDKVNDAEAGLRQRDILFAAQVAKAQKDAEVAE